VEPVKRAFTPSPGAATAPPAGDGLDAVFAAGLEATLLALRATGATPYEAAAAALAGLPSAGDVLDAIRLMGEPRFGVPPADLVVGSLETVAKLASDQGLAPVLARLEGLGFHPLSWWVAADSAPYPARMLFSTASWPEGMGPTDFGLSDKVRGRFFGGSLLLRTAGKRPALPDGLVVPANMDIYHHPAKLALPARLRVGGKLTFDECKGPLTLPMGLEVGDLQILRCPKWDGRIPADTRVAGSVITERHPYPGLSLAAWREAHPDREEPIVPTWTYLPKAR
jgi:hypothetical protein